MTYKVVSISIDNSKSLLYSEPLLTTFNTIDDELYNNRLDPSILTMSGMSGKRYRSFINLLISKINNPRYLEIGSWKGSTFCSAISTNSITATSVDNWSQFDGPKDEFNSNIAKYRSDSTHITILEQDFRSVDYSAIGKFNVYMFDGPHDPTDQYDGIVLAQPALDDEFVLIIDDWNGTHVQDPTMKAILDLGLIVDSITVITSEDGSHPIECREQSDWHNGYFLASVKKSG